jgi:hypothetical protein
VLVLTGPVGVGKSAVLHEADRLLVDAHIQHASAELEDLARCWLPPLARGARARMAYRNLAALWANYRELGADRLILSLLLEGRSDIDPIYNAVPGAEVTIVRLAAPLPLIEKRLRRRQLFPESELHAARWWFERMNRVPCGDHVVDNGVRPLEEVASEVLRLVGWLLGQ